MLASDYRQIARDSLSGSWGVSILAALIASLLGAASGGVSVNIDADNLQQLMRYEWLVPIIKAYLTYASIASIVAFILGGVVQLGYCTFLLKQHDGKDFHLKDLFSHVSTNFGGGFCLKLLTGIYTALWAMLFVIPGIVKGYSYAMAPYIMAENPDWGANDCITQSRELMDGHKFELFCLHLSFIGWSLLSLLTLGIGNLFLQPYMQAAEAAFYRSLVPAAVDETETIEE